MAFPIVLAIVLLILTVLIVLIAAILFVPLNITLRASGFSTYPTIAFVSVHWIGLRVWKKTISPGGKVETKPKKDSRKPNAGFNRFGRILNAFRDARSSIDMLFRHFLRAVSFKKLEVDVVFGTGDPADTSIAMGYFWSIRHFLDLVPKVSLKLKPDLLQERFDGSINAQASVRLFPIASGFVRAIFNKRFRTLIREVRR